MNEQEPIVLPPLLAAWSEALSPMLGLLSEQQRGPFRQELQRYLAASRFQPNDVREHTERLKELLIQAARAASQPAAINLTRDLREQSVMVNLCEHLLAIWRDAEAAATPVGDCSGPSGMSGEVFFGPRLGGPGRPGSLKRDHGEPLIASED